MDLNVAKTRVDFRLPVNIIAELDSLSLYFDCKDRTSTLCRVIQELFDSILYNEVYLPDATLKCNFDDFAEMFHRVLKPVDFRQSHEVSVKLSQLLCSGAFGQLDRPLPHEM